MCKYGYARVSTREQHLDRQINALMDAGLEKKQIIVEKQSGKDFCRQAYGRLIRRMRAGDTLFIVSIDRLGRNYTEILEQWGRITKQIGADVVVLDMPLLDTRKKDKDLTSTFMTDLVLQILSYVAQVERENIRERQAAGIAAAKAKGVRFGRKGRPLPGEFRGCRAPMAGKGDHPAAGAGNAAGRPHIFLRPCEADECGAAPAKFIII